MQASELGSIKMESTVPNQGGRPGQKQQGCGLCREMCCFLLKHLGRLSAAPMERGSSPLRSRAAQTRGVGSTLAPLMEHEPCARAVS